MSQSTYPDFIGIGAARAGTTWVAKRLDAHPEVWIPRIKELHYFSRSPKYYGPSHLHDANVFRRLLHPAQQYRRYRTHLLRAAGSNIVKPSLAKLKWDLNFYFGTPNDAWYASLFLPAGDRLTGEITPQYSILDDEDIAVLYSLMPKCKVIFIVRDPVERAWSLLRYHEKRFTRNLTSLPMNELVQEALHPAKLAGSDYPSILNRWRSVFPQDQFFLAFYDEIADAPSEFMDRLCDFLGITRLQETYDSSERINQAFEKDMPHELRRALTNYYYNSVKSLARQEGGYFEKWLSSYEEFIAASVDYNHSFNTSGE